MFFKNLKYAFRNLRRDKFYSILNGFGLVIAMAVVLLIAMWIQSELSVDNYHSKNGQNYLILGDTGYQGKRTLGIRTPAPLAPATREQVPEVQHIARTYQLWKPILKHQDFLLSVKNTFLIDPSFLDILDFEFIEGDPKTALTDPKNIVISQSIASKLFGEESAMGKTLNLGDNLELQVSGIIKDTPSNTHMPVDCFIPFENNINQFMNERSMSWASFNFSTYLLLKPNAAVQDVTKKLSHLIPLKEGETVSERNAFQLHPVKDIYLGMSEVKFGFTRGDWKHIRLFGFIGFIILLIAAINYINLTTARVAHKAKAAGIRKIVGATRLQLISQQFLEAFVLIGICSLTACLIAFLSLDFFEEFSGKDFSNISVFSANSILLSAGIAITTLLLSGIQPAIQLSSFRPAEALKGSIFKGKTSKSRLRKALVVAQFASSAALIICTLFILRQMNFIQTSKLGYKKEHTFSITHTLDDPKTLRDALKGQEGIVDVSMSDQSIVHISNQTSGFEWEGMEAKVNLPIYQVNAGHNFKEFFGLELLSGRWFNPGDKDSDSYLINEAAAKVLQLEDPVGKRFGWEGGHSFIVGVVKDFHFQSFHNDIKPLLFRQQGDWFPTIYVKTTSDKAAQAIASAENIFKKHSPNSVFEYEFLEETYDQMYKSETKTSNLFLLFALIAILISCLGIFGLATYTAEKRFKEIGVRKVLGASVYSIVYLLSKDFLQLVLVALVIAVPLAWYFMDSWLSNFAYHVSLDWWGFAAAGILAIGIALLTVGVQSFRAALANPVESIKAE